MSLLTPEHVQRAHVGLEPGGTRGDALENHGARGAFLPVVAPGKAHIGQAGSVGYRDDAQRPQSPSSDTSASQAGHRSG